MSKTKPIQIITNCSLRNRTILVTGSSRGIGRAIAAAFESTGATVIRHGNRHQPTDMPAGGTFLKADLSSPEAPEELIDAAVAAHPDLDTLVCNAGSFFDLPFLEMTPERWEQTMNLNVRAVYFIAQAFARHLASRQRKGTIVIISSTNGFFSEDESTAYDTSKGALVMMTRTLAQSLAPMGIRVNGVAPGLIRTPLTARWMDPEPEKCRHYEKKILLGRIGSEQDCAGPTLFLASDDSAYMTGQILVVDGGLTVGQIGKS